jgi:hypothetical protein
MFVDFVKSHKNNVRASSHIDFTTLECSAFDCYEVIMFHALQRIVFALRGFPHVGFSRGWRNGDGSMLTDRGSGRSDPDITRPRFSPWRMRAIRSSKASRSASTAVMVSR